MSLVTQNINRLNHLLALFKLSKDDLLNILNEESEKKINEEDVFGTFIKTSVLNKIDKIFNKGLAYYANPSTPILSTEESIFFRKDSFNSSLNLPAKQIVNRFEEEKLSFDTLLKLSDIEGGRGLPTFTASDNPIICARNIRDLIYPLEKTDDKGFLKNLIAGLAEKNVLVFEFVEGSRKKERASILGFFLSPNVIVLKWQKYHKREIFTLAHEIGHYLLNEEDIDEKVGSEVVYDNISEIEKWCNDFAFSFLSGDYLTVLDGLENATVYNDYHDDLIKEISSNTHLSTLALYTHLLYNNKISKSDYKIKSDDIAIAIKNKEAEDERLLQIKKLKDELAGKKPGGGAVKALLSPLYIQTLQTALYNGFVDEYEFCRRLKINPNKIEDYLV